ncbi:MAG TPA: hypothetical protein VKR80_07930, partial [Candidatus Limnocylindria bacterium]|nr:hypothetical protein [Candidatus Limnocylindria bacterium]
DSGGGGAPVGVADGVGLRDGVAVAVGEGRATLGAALGDALAVGGGGTVCGVQAATAATAIATTRAVNRSGRATFVVSTNDGPVAIFLTTKPTLCTQTVRRHEIW